jgi:hypothetical protein
VIVTAIVAIFGTYAISQAIPVNFEITVTPVGNRDQAFTENCKLREQAQEKLGQIYLFEYNQGESDSPLQTSAITWKEVMRGSPETYCVGTANFLLNKNVGYIFYSGESTAATVDPWEVSSGSLRWKLQYDITQKATVALDIVSLSNPCVSKGKPVAFCYDSVQLTFDETNQKCSAIGRLASLTFGKAITIRGLSTGLETQPVFMSGESWSVDKSNPSFDGEPTLTCHLLSQEDIHFDPEGYTVDGGAWGFTTFTTSELESNNWTFKLRNDPNRLVRD